MLQGITRVKQFKTSPEAEAKGQIMMAWLSNQLEEYTKPRLEYHNITEIDPDEWYPFQTFLDIMHEIVLSEDNMTMILVAVGKAVVQNLPLSDFETMQDFHIFVDNLHPSSVRNMPDYENIMLIEDGSNYYLVNNTPVSNDVLYGFFWELLRKYKINGVQYTLVPHENYPSDVGSTFLIEPL